MTDPFAASSMNISEESGPEDSFISVNDCMRVMVRFGTRLFLLLAALLALSSLASAQYFGRNKVQYETFDFHVMKTEHFDIYFYPEEEAAVRDAARMAERWYSRLSGIFKHEFSARKPILFYADQTDFQQTNAIGGEIGEGTGGVTEALKNRVILPFTGSYAENDHVLGHELVHAFQYDYAQRGRGQGGIDVLSRLPLWLIEGMAEFLSLGHDDPNTAMWLRDAALRNDIPTIDQLSSDPRYFPYRYGEALLAYIGGKWGDEAVVRIFKGGAAGGNLDSALRRVVGMDADSLSKQWIAAVRAEYDPLMASRAAARDIARRVLAKDIDAGDMNVAPAISPDGKYVIFLSSLDIFDIDLYLADAHTGKVLKKLVSANTDPHFDAISFINSAGSWSDDGKKFAFVVSAQGNNEIAILDVASRDIERQIRINGISGITNPAWSPDGKTIVFSGLAGGISDLYLLDVPTGTARKLTDDKYMDMQPVWSPDGRTVAFVTDHAPRTDLKDLRYSPAQIAIINVSTLALQVLPLFSGGKNINPQFSPDGRSLYFISDQDGFSDIYRYALDGSGINRVTEIKTGVSGITGMSPAMTVAQSSGRMMFSAFEKSSYSVYALEADSTRGTPLRMLTGDSAVMAGTLPPLDAHGTGPIQAYLQSATGGLPATSDYKVGPYDPSLQLDYIGAQAGVGYNTDYGAGLGGGIAAYFSDILGNRNLTVIGQLNGTLQDLGGQVFYLNSRNRWNWGVGAAHFPYVSTFTGSGDTVIDGRVAQTFDQYFQRVFVDEGSVLAQYPFSTTQRFEVSLGYTHYGYSLTRDRYVVSGGFVESGPNSIDLPSPDGLNLFQGSFALVGDNSFFGFTSPINGGRYRVEAGGTTGSLSFGTLLADFRRYFFFNPLTVAVRGFHYGRYGPNAGDTRLTPLFLGYDAYVRGYNANSFDPTECTGPGCPEFDRLLGSRVAIGTLELRIPVFGTSQFGLVNFPYLPFELVGFFDGGAAWGEVADVATYKPLRLAFETRTTDRVPVFSAGVSGRFNLFGYIVLELYYAYPFQRPDAGWTFGFQIAPGW
jgi:Tol biopolymer transport system component